MGTRNVNEEIKVTIWKLKRIFEGTSKKEVRGGEGTTEEDEEYKVKKKIGMKRSILRRVIKKKRRKIKSLKKKWRRLGERGGLEDSQYREKKKGKGKPDY